MGVVDIELYGMKEVLNLSSGCIPSIDEVFAPASNENLSSDGDLGTLFISNGTRGRILVSTDSDCKHTDGTRDAWKLTNAYCRNGTDHLPRNHSSVRIRLEAVDDDLIALAAVLLNANGSTQTIVDFLTVA
eukprot:scaffold38036_cov50-Attheya_sp.AAC.3